MRRTTTLGFGIQRVGALGLALFACACWTGAARPAQQEPAQQEPAQQEPAQQELAQQEPAQQEPEQQPAEQQPAQQQPGQGARAELLRALEEQGVHLDIKSGVVSVAARVLVRDELLEYLLVSPRGQSHESLFGTDAPASAIHTAMLLAGFESGTNARWVPNPLGAEVGARRPSFDVLPPVSSANGPDVYLYAAWRDGDELYFFRVDDLIADLSTGRSMRRHGWVYLGSREVPARGGQPGGFAADLLGNLISVSFFQEGVTLVTAALPECLDQTIWAANPWLVPEREQPVRFLLSPRPLVALPETLLPLVPSLVRQVEAGADEAQGDPGGG